MGKGVLLVIAVTLFLAACEADLFGRAIGDTLTENFIVSCGVPEFNTGTITTEVGTENTLVFSFESGESGGGLNPIGGIDPHGDGEQGGCLLSDSFSVDMNGDGDTDDPEDLNRLQTNQENNLISFTHIFENEQVVNVIILARFDSGEKIDLIIPFDVAAVPVLGCTDPTALNYDPSATEDDGSCIYPEYYLDIIDPASFEIEVQGGVVYVEFETNAEWEAIHSGSWLVLDLDSGMGDDQIEVVVLENTGEERTGQVIIQSIDGSVSGIFTVTQAGVLLPGTECYDCLDNLCFLDCDLECFESVFFEKHGDGVCDDDNPNLNCISEGSDFELFNDDGDCVNYLIITSPGDSGFTVSSAGGSPTTNFQSDSEWVVSSDVEWISFDSSTGSGDGTVTLTVAPSNNVASREGVITLSLVGYDVSDSFIVYQAGADVSGECYCEEGSCVFDCDLECVSGSDIANLGDGNCDSYLNCESFNFDYGDCEVESCMDPSADNYNPSGTVPCDDCCYYLQDQEFDPFDCNDPSALNYNPNGSSNAACIHDLSGEVITQSVSVSPGDVLLSFYVQPNYPDNSLFDEVFPECPLDMNVLSGGSSAVCLENSWTGNLLNSPLNVINGYSITNSGDEEVSWDVTGGYVDYATEIMLDGNPKIIGFLWPEPSSVLINDLSPEILSNLNYIRTTTDVNCCDDGTGNPTLEESCTFNVGKCWFNGGEYVDNQGNVFISTLDYLNTGDAYWVNTVSGGFSFVWYSPVEGCTDPSALNYDVSANVYDGSCEYSEISGCTDSDALNYDEFATVDDGSCTYSPSDVSGCTDEDACNFDPLATVDDDSCVFANLYYDCSGVCLNDVDSDLVCDELEVDGCTDPSALNYDVDATEDDGSCAYEEVIEASGCTNVSSPNYDDEATVDDGSCLPGCFAVDELSDCEPFGMCDTNADGLVDVEDVLYLFDLIEEIVEGSCGNSYDCYCNLNADEFGLIDHNDLLLFVPFFDGCTDPSALNYDPNSVNDDGSCEYIYGCMDSEALNYDPGATADDGSCNYDDVQPQLVYGCMTPGACNYNPEATQSGEEFVCWYNVTGCSCDDGQGAVLDQCGVCNGNNSCLGCTDPSAFNYDVDATVDNGSCTYSLSASNLVAVGSDNMISLTWNHPSSEYTFNILRDDVIYEWGVSETSFDDINLGFSETHCYKIMALLDGLESDNFSNEACATTNSLSEEDVPGCTDPSALNYDVDATEDDGSCEYEADISPPVITIGWNSSEDIIEVVVVAVDDNIANLNLSLWEEYVVNDTSLCDPVNKNVSCTGNTCSLEANLSGCGFGTYHAVSGSCDVSNNCNDSSSVFEYFESLGCTDSGANNYDLDATVDDSSCLFSPLIEFSVGEGYPRTVYVSIFDVDNISNVHVFREGPSDSFSGYIESVVGFEDFFATNFSLVGAGTHNITITVNDTLNNVNVNSLVEVIDPSEIPPVTIDVSVTNEDYVLASDETLDFQVSLVGEGVNEDYFVNYSLNFIGDTNSTDIYDFSNFECVSNFNPENLYLGLDCSLSVSEFYLGDGVYYLTVSSYSQANLIFDYSTFAVVSSTEEFDVDVNTSYGDASIEFCFSDTDDCVESDASDGSFDIDELAGVEYDVEITFGEFTIEFDDVLVNDSLNDLNLSYEVYEDAGFPSVDDPEVIEYTVFAHLGLESELLDDFSGFTVDYSSFEVSNSEDLVLIKCSDWDYSGYQCLSDLEEVLVEVVSDSEVFVSSGNFSIYFFGEDLLGDEEEEDDDTGTDTDTGTDAAPPTNYGCTDVSASNYDVDAEVDDDSCVYPPSVPGCIDSEALNYNASANVDDGSCEYSTELITNLTAELNESVNVSEPVVNDTLPPEQQQPLTIPPKYLTGLVVVLLIGVLTYFVIKRKKVFDEMYEESVKAPKQPKL